MPGIARDNRFTKQWIDIGFQGSDPVTDFRGTGLLGLVQLHSFNIGWRAITKEMFKNSANPETWYFFCVTGINITQKLVQSLVRPSSVMEPLINLDKYLLRHLGEFKSQLHFNKAILHLYVCAFRLFDEMWTNSRPTNIMNFNQFLSDVFTLHFEKKVSDCLDEFFVA